MKTKTKKQPRRPKSIRSQETELPSVDFGRSSFKEGVCCKSGGRKCVGKDFVCVCTSASGGADISATILKLEERMIKPIVKTTPEQYNGAERLCEKMVDFLEVTMEKHKKSKNHYSPIVVATLDQVKWVMLAEMKMLLCEVDNELNEQEEHFKNGRLEL